MFEIVLKTQGLREAWLCCHIGLESHPGAKLRGIQRDGSWQTLPELKRQFHIDPN